MSNNMECLGLISSFLSITLANVKDILSIISLVLSLLFTCFLIFRAFKSAISDGKITKEEKDELIELTKDAIDKGKELTDKLENKGDDDQNV